MGARGFARPGAFSSAETDRYSVSDSGGMVPSPGREEYRRHSSSHLTARVIIKEEGGPASFRRGYPSCRIGNLGPHLNKQVSSHHVSPFLDLIIKQKFSRTCVFCFHIVKFGGLYQAIPHFYLLVFGRPPELS